MTNPTLTQAAREYMAGYASRSYWYLIDFAKNGKPRGFICDYGTGRKNLEADYAAIVRDGGCPLIIQGRQLA